jgi:hypothetical protein
VLRNAFEEFVARLKDPVTSVKYVEASLRTALPDETWAWHRCVKRPPGWVMGAKSEETETRHPDYRWLFYPKDQGHLDELEKKGEPFWRSIQRGERAYPEGLWYALEVSFDRHALFFIHGNRMSDGFSASLEQQGTMVDFELLSFAGVTEPEVLARLIVKLVKTKEPNFFALT